MEIVWQTWVFQIRSSEGVCVRGAAVLAAYPDGRYLTGQTDVHGECRLDLYRTDQNMKVLVAAEGHLPFHDGVVPGKSETIPLKLIPSTKERKAVLFTRSTGYIPGIAGRLDPHQDGYVYGENIAINGQLAEPAAHFEDWGSPSPDRRLRCRDHDQVSGGRGPVFAYRIL